MGCAATTREERGWSWLLWFLGFVGFGCLAVFGAATGHTWHAAIDGFIAGGWLVIAVVEFAEPTP